MAKKAKSNQDNDAAKYFAGLERGDNVDSRLVAKRNFLTDFSIVSVLFILRILAEDSDESREDVKSFVDEYLSHIRKQADETIMKHTEMAETDVGKKFQNKFGDGEDWRLHIFGTINRAEKFIYSAVFADDDDLDEEDDVLQMHF